MNLTQIEQRFRCVDLLSGYLNHKYNPRIKRVAGLQKHIYEEELQQCNEVDKEIFGNVAFEEDEDTKQKRLNTSHKTPRASHRKAGPAKSLQGALTSAKKGGLRAESSKQSMTSLKT